MFSKRIILISLFFLGKTLSIYSQEEEDANEDIIPFDAIIQSEMGGKRVKFYGNTSLNFNQAYFSNWISVVKVL